MSLEYDDCAAKIHIGNLDKEITEMKDDQKVVTAKLDGIKNLLIGSLFTIVTSIVVAGIAIVLFGG